MLLGVPTLSCELSAFAQTVCRNTNCQSEQKLRGQLDDARRLGRGHAPKLTGCIDVCAGCIELRVVEEIEELKPHFNPGAFRDPRIFVEPEIPIIDSRAMEEVASGVPHHSALLGGK